MQQYSTGSQQLCHHNSWHENTTDRIFKTVYYVPMQDAMDVDGSHQQRNHIEAEVHPIFHVKEPIRTLSIRCVERTVAQRYLQ